MSDKGFTDQEQADVDFANEMLAETHNHLADTIEKLMENVSAENSNPCLFSYLMQMEVFIRTTFKELLQAEEGDAWPEAVQDFFDQHPEAFETKIWTERIDH